VAKDRKPTPATEVPDRKRQEGDADQSLLGRVTRRSFLSHLGAAGIAATASPVLAATATQESPAVDAASESQESAGTVPVTLRVNGKSHVLRLDPRTTLLDCLRENLNLPGTKKGCDHGQCGACTVIINGRRVNSCLTLAVIHEGDEVTTIEGLGTPAKLHPMQAAFIKHDGYQCGYCTSGQICSSVAMLTEMKSGAPSHVSDSLVDPIKPTRREMSERMSGNICRCGAYSNIVEAIADVAGIEI
jgi:xanthine dehydrogenase YagT iron-sulfur-binding subunit